MNVWHHVAVTYDGSTGGLYIDGVLDATPDAGDAHAFDVDREHAAIATSLDDAAVEVPEGFFQGQMDEARIWNVARTPAQIAAAYQLEIPSATGLLGRYAMNEGLGTAVGDSSGTRRRTAPPSVDPPGFRATPSRWARLTTRRWWTP